jgi:amino acid transporter
MTIGFVFTLLTSGAVWMIGSDRIQAVAAFDGAFAGFFGKFNERFGTPIRVNTLSGIVASIFMVTAVAFFNNGEDSAFAVVLTIAISTTLISYLWIFAAAVRLRTLRPHVARPYVVPGGRNGIRVAGALSIFWVALGSFVAVFPGTLEKLFGLDYAFKDTWGVSQAKFEVLTLGTLAIVLLIALVGYALGRPVRARTAVLPLEPGVGGAAPAPAGD